MIVQYQFTSVNYKNGKHNLITLSTLMTRMCIPGLVVAVKDHEHFRLKLVYSRKKKIQNSLRETEVKLQILRVSSIPSSVI